MEKIKTYKITKMNRDLVETMEDKVVIEHPFTIYFNEKELVTILCTPEYLEDLTIGFLYSEGLIDSIEDIKSIEVQDKLRYIKVKTYNANTISEQVYEKRAITSGCGKGSIYYRVVDSLKARKILSDFEINNEELIPLLKEFSSKSKLFEETGGVHSCALCVSNQIVCFREDIGRHNAIDKIIGFIIKNKIDISNSLILTSGRISSEIIIKIGRIKIPMIVSRSAPTSLAIDLANNLNIKLIGFARGSRLNIYTKQQNIGGKDEKDT